MEVLLRGTRCGVSWCMKFLLWEFLLKLRTLNTLGMKIHLVCLVVKQKSIYPGNQYCFFLREFSMTGKVFGFQPWLRLHCKEFGFLCVIFQLIQVRNRDIAPGSPPARQDKSSLNFLNIYFSCKLHPDLSTCVFVRKELPIKSHVYKSPL